MSPACRLLIAALILTTTSSAGFAQVPLTDLRLASIEQLMNIEVTSVSHKEQRVGDVAAAITVLTQEDIRRSGMTTVPELLRLVPGVQVAQINSNKWAIAIRGFNGLFADKLLVLVDGQTVYDRLNSGLFWESLDVPLDQIERIEVIRGPGGATWGANAVNGVINIVTRSASELPGGAIAVGGGTFDGWHAAARYGGRLGRVAYRVYSQGSAHGESRIDDETSADDRWQNQSYGFRLDWIAGRDTFMAKGGATLGKLRGLWSVPSGPVPAAAATSDLWSSTEEYYALGRWTHRRDSGATLQVQSAIDFRVNIDSDLSPRQLQADIDAQYHTAAGPRNDVVAGVGYRVVDENVRGGFSFSIAPEEVTDSVANFFVQDEIALGSRVRLILGAKVEHASYVGWGVQPTARVMWMPGQRQHVWGAVSRALRTPALGDLSGRYNYTSFIGPNGLPVLIGALGNPAFQSEEVLTTEAGYRREFAQTVSIDVTAFASRYDRLKTSEPVAPRFEPLPAPEHLFVPVQFGNLLEATASGVEVSVRWTPITWCHVEASSSAFHLTPRLSPASGDPAASSFDGNVPDTQWQARSAFSLPHGVQLDASLFHAGALRTRDMSIDAYTRVDARVAVPLTPRLYLSFVGQNLFDSEHAEFAGQAAIVGATLIPRSASVNLVWRMQP